MKLSFHGAARTVTGSKHLIHLNNGKKILLDCGLFQGMGHETMELNAEFGFEATDITHVVISHAHIDHVGLLPKLVKEGYKGQIYCTSATAAIAKELLLDSANIQEADVRYVNKIRVQQGKPLVKPLYTVQDAQNVFPKLVEVRKGERTLIDEDIELLYTEAGHIIGSACVHLQLKESGKLTALTFSGDIGRYRDPLLRAPDKFPQADYIILESTYGDKSHPYNVPPADQLYEHIQKTCVEKKGKLIIPAFSVGRTQELLFALNQLSLENRLPAIEYFVDSPLSVRVTGIVKRFPYLFNDRVQEVLKTDSDPFMFPGLTMIEEVEASKALNFKKEPCVIISASGMAVAGRIKHHIANNIENANNTILLVGYCEPNSLGGRLKAGATSVGIFGQDFMVKANVETIESLSAHGDYNEISQWLACQNPKEVKKLFLVHGEYEAQQQFSSRLKKKGFWDVVIPHLHQEIGLG